MKTLELAVQAAARSNSSTNQKVRAAIAAQLERLGEDCAAALGVWKDFLAKPAAAGDQWSIVAWVGAARAKQLYDINLAARQRLRIIGDLAGGDAARLMDYEEDAIEMAYRQLKAGESGVEAANAAVAKLNERIQLFERLRRELGKVPSGTAAPKARGAKKKKSGKKSVAARKPKAAKRSKAKPKKKAPAKK